MERLSLPELLDHLPAFVRVAPVSGKQHFEFQRETLLLLDSAEYHEIIEGGEDLYWELRFLSVPLRFAPGLLMDESPVSMPSLEGG